MEQIRISAKNLGAFALPDFCPRCAWIKLHCPNLPFQIFPGIFSSIDSYSKKITNLHFDKHNKIPVWLSDFGEIGRPIKSPHYTKFNTVDEKTDILLTGSPDEMFCKSDGSHFIVDYKTAKFTGTQDELFPVYGAQLNAYAYIGDRCGFKPVTGLGLVYYEPLTDITTDEVNSFLLDNGFSMHFTGKLLPVKINPAMITQLLAKVRDVYDKPLFPYSTDGCKNCVSLDLLLSRINKRQTGGG